MPQPLHSKTSVDGTIHAHWFDYVRNSFASAEKTYRRSQQIVEAVQVNQVKPRDGGPRECYHTGIERERSIVGRRGEVDSFHAIFLGTPSPLTAPEIRV